MTQLGSDINRHHVASQLHPLSIFVSAATPFQIYQKHGKNSI